MMRILKYSLPFVVMLMLLSSCTDKTLSPIFYTLETERSLAEDRGLEDKIIVHEIVQAGAGPRFFAAAYTLYTRTDSGNWSVVTPPLPGARCNTLGVYGGNLYAGFYTDSGAGLGLWYTNPDTISWTAVTDADWNATNKRIGLIKAGPTELFVSIQNNLYYSATPAASGTYASAVFDVTPEPTVPIIDVVHDGASYWVIAGPYLYSDALLSNLQKQVLPADPAVGGGYNYGGLLYSSTKGGGTVYLSAEDGKIWAYNAAVWTSSTTISAADDPVGFTQLVELETTDSDIWVGSKGTGYYRLVGGSISSGNVLRSPSYNISDLYNGAILGFLADPSTVPTKVFAATYGAGLWRADWDGDSWEWVQE